MVVRLPLPPAILPRLVPSSTVTALLVGLLAGCAAPPPPTTLRVGTIGSIDELPLFVIQEQGLARKHGLELQTFPQVGGARIIEGIAAGTLDVGWSVGTVPVLSAAERGVVPQQVVAVATNALADPERPGMAVVVSPAIGDWRDLNGKLIGVYVVNSLGGASLKVRLEQEGVRDYRLIEIALPNLGLALAGGMVAAATMPEPFVSQSILRGDGKLLSWIIGGPPLERMVYTLICASARLYREQRDRVQAVLWAHLEAVEWIDANPEHARSLMARRLGITDDLGRRINLMRWPLDGRNDPTLFTGMQQVLVQARLLQTPIPAQQVFELAALDDVLRHRGR